MKLKALVVEDDDRIIDSIEDALCSIGHDHEWATNQDDARKMLEAGNYAYVLLDLQIPAKPNRGGADKEFGVNLLADIQHIKGPHRLPVIVMTAHSADCLDLTTELFSGGASDFIAKPFSNKGRTLTKVIRKVLSDHERKTTAYPDDHAPLGEQPFAGGEMVFYGDRVDLCGVRVVCDRGAGQCMLVLDELRQKGVDGRYVCRSGEELAKAIKATGGATAVAGCIRRIRDNICQRLKKEVRITCQRDDVIRSNEQGYSLRDWITARNGDLPIATGHPDRYQSNQCGLAGRRESRRRA